MTDSWVTEHIKVAPEAWFRLGEILGYASNNRMVDSSGNHNHGVYYPQFPTAGYPVQGGAGQTNDLDHSIQFSGSNYGTAPHIGTYQPGNTMSVEAWVNFDSISARCRVAAVDGCWAAGFTGATQQLLFTNYTVADYGINVPALQTGWHHVVWVYDTGTVTAYLDGAQIGTPNAQGNSAIHTASNPLTVGAVQSPGNSAGLEFFTGGLDEVCYYAKALTAAQVATLYASASVAPAYVDDGSHLANYVGVGGISSGSIPSSTDTADAPPVYLVPGSSFGYYDAGATPGVISFDVKSSDLSDFFFGCNSSGVGYMVRIDVRGGYPSGIGVTNSWTTWVQPPDTNLADGQLLTNRWHHVVIQIAAGVANIYIDGNRYEPKAVSFSGTYIGLNGDGLAAGASPTNFYDNIVVHAAPAAPLPVISNVTVVPGVTTAHVTWTTDIAATSQVSYGTSPAQGSTSTLDSTLVTSHSVNLTGLNPNTLYHYSVLSSNVVSADQTFSTSAAGRSVRLYDPAPSPAFSNQYAGRWSVSVGPYALPIGATGLDEFDFEVPTPGFRVGSFFGFYLGNQAGFMPQPAQGLTFDSNAIPAWATGGDGYQGNYYYTYQYSSGSLTLVTLWDQVYNNYPGTFGLTVDPLSDPSWFTSPTISNVLVTLGKYSAQISFTTDVSADAQIAYGPTNAYGSLSPMQDIATAHGLSVTGLIAGTTYHYQIITRSAAGATTTADATFTTLAPGGPVNDYWADAINMPGRTGTLTGSNVAATNEANEPVSYNSTQSHNGIWYKWYCDADNLSIAVNTYGSTYPSNPNPPVGGSGWLDTVLDAWSGTDISNLVFITFDDDDSTGQYGYNSNLIVQATKGVTYYFRVYGYGPSDEGNIILHWNAYATVPLVLSNYQAAVSGSSVTLSFDTNLPLAYAYFYFSPTPSSPYYYFGGYFVADSTQLHWTRSPSYGTTPLTTFYYEIFAYTLDYTLTTSPPPPNMLSFTTGPPQLPVISNVSVDSVGKNYANVSWQTDITANYNYVTIVGGGVGTYQATNGLNHGVHVAGLAPNTTYTFIVSSQNNDGTTTSGQSTFTTTQWLERGGVAAHRGVMKASMSVDATPKKLLVQGHLGAGIVGRETTPVVANPSPVAKGEIVFSPSGGDVGYSTASPFLVGSQGLRVVALRMGVNINYYQAIILTLHAQDPLGNRTDPPGATITYPLNSSYYQIVRKDLPPVDIVPYSLIWFTGVGTGPIQGGERQYSYAVILEYA